MSTLALVRHGESQWNARGLWTGWTDIPLSDKGCEEARKAADLLHGIQFDYTYTSKLIRASETLEIIKKELQITVPTIAAAELNERNYGIYTGKNKWEIKNQIGEEKFQQLRRGWDFPIEKGESLKDVYTRVVPYYEKEIRPKLQDGKNVLLAAHGNSIRALVKFLESISDDEISKVELVTGEILIYTLDASGAVIKKERRGGTL